MVTGRPPRRSPPRVLRRPAARAGAALLAALLGLAAACSGRGEGDGGAAAAPERPRAVTVTATGRHRVHPDVVSVDLRVEHESPAAQTAWSVAADRLQDLEAELERAGVRRTDMRPLDHALVERWLSPGGEPARSYRASLVLRATLRDLARLPDVLAAAAGLGVDGVDGVRFGFADPAPLRERAREQAIGAAREQAQTLAEESQQRLGRVLSIVEEPAAAGPDGAAPVGEPYEFAVTVTATWALSDH